MPRTFSSIAQTALLQLQESIASGDMLHSNVRARLDGAIGDHFRNGNRYGYYLDHSGDGEDGDVVYSCSGDTMRCPYHIATSDDGKAVTTVDFGSAKNVVPVTSYQEEADDADEAEHIASMEAERLYTPGSLPLCERFVSKKDRDAADAEDFAGKGKSFPILKAEDVDAAARSLGRAGEGNYSIAKIKRNIIAIAKRKGWAKMLPRSWQMADDELTDATKQKESALAVRTTARQQRVTEAKKKSGMVDCADCSGTGVCADCDGNGEVEVSEAATKKMTACAKCDGSGDCAACKGEGRMKESAKPDVAPIKLVEGCVDFLSEIPLREASRTSYPVKLISPGTGTTAHYPADVLERDGPKIFKAGTLMMWNHPTAAEEAARPEGDLNNLAAILTKDAEWKVNGPKGPGLYSEAKVMADYAEKVAERAPHIGLSIRAGGTASGKVVNGKPELASLDYAESVDYVTKAGRGGIALAESSPEAVRLAEASRILTEAAPAADSNTREVAGEMTKEEMQQAIQTAVREAVATKNQPLIERAVKGDATRLMEAELSTIELPDAQKQLVRETVFRFPLPLNGDFLDETKFTESVRDEAKRVGRAFAEATGGGRIFGMGAGFTPAPAQLDDKQIQAREAARKAEDDDAVAIFESLMGSGDQARRAALGTLAGKRAN